MIKKSFRILLYLTLFFSLAPDILASWSGPVEVYSAIWGNADGQLGLEFGDTADNFPRSILITDDQRILVGDVVNDKIVIINQQGKFYKSFRPSALPPGTHMAPHLQWATLKGAKFLLKLGGNYQIYNTEGLLVHQFKGTSDNIIEIVSLPDNSIIVHKDEPNSYYRYNSDGTLLSIDTTEFQELRNFYNQRKKITKSVAIPRSSENIEIGPPVVAPNGDVYFWQKTQADYSIKRWKNE